MGAYVIAKTALIRFTQDLAAELVAQLASGQEDSLPGCLLGVADDLQRLLAQLAEVKRSGLYTLRVRKLYGRFANRPYVSLNCSSISTWYPLARRFVSFAIPTTAISSENMESVIPALRAAAEWEAMQ